MYMTYKLHGSDTMLWREEGKGGNEEMGEEMGGKGGWLHEDSVLTIFFETDTTVIH